jgi:hypothetical protein
MDTNEAEGFFPEREVLRARRLRAMVNEPVDPSEVRTRRIGIWMTLSVATFLPTFVNAITFGWNGHVTPRSTKVVTFALWLVLAACGALVTVGIWRNIRRANNPGS